MLIFLFQCRSKNTKYFHPFPNLLWYSFVFCRILCRNVCLRPSGLMKQSEEQIQCQSHVTYAIPPLSSNQVCCTHHNFPVSPDYWVEEKLNRWDHPVSFHVCHGKEMGEMEDFWSIDELPWLSYFLYQQIPFFSDWISFCQDLQW